MLTLSQRIQWVICGVILVISGVGCDLTTDRTKSAQPGTPINAYQQANFWAEAVPPAIGEITEFSYTVQNGVLLASVFSGEYMLKYVTPSGEYYLVFRAIEDAILHIGLSPDSTVSEARLIDGKIVETAQPIVKSGNVFVYYWPESTFSWQEVFLAENYPEQPEPAKPEPEKPEPAEPEEEWHPPTTFPPCF